MHGSENRVRHYLCILCQVDEGIQLVTASDILCFYPLQVHSEVVGGFAHLTPCLMQLGLHMQQNCLRCVKFGSWVAHLESWVA